MNAKETFDQLPIEQIPSVAPVELSPTLFETVELLKSRKYNSVSELADKLDCSYTAASSRISLVRRAFGLTGLKHVPVFEKQIDHLLPIIEQRGYKLKPEKSLLSVKEKEV